MSEPVTIEDIYQLFRASAEEFDRRLRESDRRAAEANAEADRRAAEADRRAAASKLESDRNFAELKRTLEQTSRRGDNLTDQWGQFVENLIESAISHIFQEKKIDIKEIYRGVKSKRESIAMEIDILAVNETALVIVELLPSISQDDVDEFLEKLTRFKIAFPHYKSYRVYGAVAGIEINEGVDRYAYKKGLFVIKPTGDTVTIANDANFQPMTW